MEVIIKVELHPGRPLGIIFGVESGLHQGESGVHQGFVLWPWRKASFPVLLQEEIPINQVIVYNSSQGFGASRPPGKVRCFSEKALKGGRGSKGGGDSGSSAGRFFSAGFLSMVLNPVGTLQL